MVLDEEEENLITIKGLEGTEGNFLGLRKAKGETEGSQIARVGLSLSSVVGLTSPKTMKLQGAIGEQPMVILIDSGATHNFISSGLVQKMEIPIEITKTYGVLLGTGSVQGTGICRKVVVCLQGIEVMEDFMSFELSSSNIILSIKWLEAAGNMHINWRSQRMSF